MLYVTLPLFRLAQFFLHFQSDANWLVHFFSSLLVNLLHLKAKGFCSGGGSFLNQLFWFCPQVTTFLPCILKPLPYDWFVFSFWLLASCCKLQDRGDQFLHQLHWKWRLCVEDISYVGRCQKQRMLDLLEDDFEINPCKKKPLLRF